MERVDGELRAGDVKQPALHVARCTIARPRHARRAQLRQYLVEQHARAASQGAELFSPRAVIVPRLRLKQLEDLRRLLPAHAAAGEAVGAVTRRPRAKLLR